MILLTSTSDTLAVVTGSTGNIDVHASYVDYNGTVVTPGRTNTAQITGAVASPGTTIVGSPGSSTQRNAKHISIRNAHASTSNAITVQHFDGTTTTTLVKYTLLAGESLQYWDERGWIVIDASGGIKNAPAAGRLLKVTFTTTASANFTTGPATNSINVKVQAGGGQGGGGLIGSSTASIGGGGGAGGYAEKLFAVSPNTAYAYTCGAGGTTGTTGNGQAGTDSTFVVSGVTVTAKGGNFGTGGGTAGSTALAIAGGAETAISTNGDLNSAGASGGTGIRQASGTVGATSGAGGNSVFGAGGAPVIAQGAGRPGIGNGSGGSGACVYSTASNGGAGAAGAIIVEEYS